MICDPMALYFWKKIEIKSYVSDVVGAIFSKLTNTVHI